MNVKPWLVLVLLLALALAATCYFEVFNLARGEPSMTTSTSEAAVQAAVEAAQGRFSTWQRPHDAELGRKLSILQLSVTQRGVSEPPFRNEYWNNFAEGIYVDRVSGEPLFSSQHKFEHASGWPAFDRPLPGVMLKLKQAELLPGYPRVEVRSQVADSHLGHLFEDGYGPEGTTGSRYSINSASLRFVPVAEMDDEGFGQLRVALFGAEMTGSEL
eukprot:gnl/TRDRNA2_/TRDRNA2_171800_c2_seq3.p1 gnl/TRDRNA2_/TRDRNA2_171800_c2~~gnl/TRDRNA2_/TRDRNA2_171800_c2_seq3.p1  ORF type:complete len:215 (+),score=45.10 gnl/TRDRNA2_/TRDRNA2_171800_c2_seq3:449-1093(+)